MLTLRPETFVTFQTSWFLQIRTTVSNVGVTEPLRPYVESLKYDVTNNFKE